MPGSEFRKRYAMTLEEAKALVLHEGLAGETAPKDAAFILLHFGDELSRDRMRNLLKALFSVSVVDAGKLVKRMPSRSRQVSASVVRRGDG